MHKAVARRHELQGFVPVFSFHTRPGDSTKFGFLEFPAATSTFFWMAVFCADLMTLCLGEKDRDLIVVFDHPNAHNVLI